MFALHHVYHFKYERTLSRVITLIIIKMKKKNEKKKQIFLFFVFHELDI